MNMSVLRSTVASVLLLLFWTTASSTGKWADWKVQSRAMEPLSADQVFVLEPTQLEGDTPTARGNIASNHYIYRASLKAEDATGNAVPLELPEGSIHEDEFFGKTEVYEAPAVRIGFPPNGVGEVTLLWQGCATSGVCYPPQEVKVSLGETSAPLASTSASQPTSARSLSLELSEEQQAAEQLTSQNPVTSAAVFFGLGLLLAFTPCSLPMIPIVSSIVVGGASPRRAFILAAVYTLSMALVYAVVGVLAGMVGANLQAALQTPWLLTAFAVLFIVLATSLFGAFELRMPARVQERLNATSQGKQGGSMFGAAGLGLLSALLVGPCMTAPLAGAMLYVGQSGSAMTGGIALFMLGIGMGSPLVLIAGFGASLLPKPGPWMERVRTAFGYVMLAMAVMMVSRFLPESFSLALWGSLLIALAVGLFGWASGAQSMDGRALGALRSLGLMSGIWGLLLLLGAATGGHSLTAPLSHTNAQSTAPATAVQFIAANEPIEVEQRIAEAARQGKWTLVDFYADWCISCHVNESNVLKAPKVVERLSKMQVLRPDVTANGASAKELLRRWNVQGPPTLILVGPDGKERRAQRLIGELTEQQFLDALNAAGV